MKVPTAVYLYPFGASVIIAALIEILMVGDMKAAAKKGSKRAQEYLLYRKKRGEKMNETLVGSAKSRMMWLNGSGIAGIVAAWNDPMIAALPDPVKYGVIIFLALNMLLRLKTSQSLAEKGKTEPKPEMVDRVSQAIVDSDQFIATVEKLFGPDVEDSKNRIRVLEDQLGKFTLALRKMQEAKKEKVIS